MLDLISKRSLIFFLAGSLIGFTFQYLVLGANDKGSPKALHYPNDKVSPGCILFAYDEPFSSINNESLSKHRERIFLVNKSNEIVKSWKSNLPVTKALMSKNGDVWALAGLAWDETSKPTLLKFSWDGTLLEQFEIPKIHHDFSFIDEETVLLIRKDEIDSNVLPKAFSTRPIWVSDSLIEYSLKERKVVHELPLAQILPIDAPKKAEKDKGHLFHTNSIVFLKSNPINQKQAYLVSTRNTSRVSIIDRETSKPLFITDKGQLSGQHCVSLLDSGNILVFDNGVDRGYSTIKEIDPIEQKIAWEWRTTYKHDFYNRVEGCVQRLENGNNLITYSMNGSVFEIDGKGEPVYQFVGPQRKISAHYVRPFYPIYQSRKYSEKEIPFSELGVNCQ